jgi:hypothetical protein
MIDFAVVVPICDPPTTPPCTTPLGENHSRALQKAPDQDHLFAQITLHGQSNHPPNGNSGPSEPTPGPLAEITLTSTALARFEGWG